MNFVEKIMYLSYYVPYPVVLLTPPPSRDPRQEGKQAGRIGLVKLHCRGFDSSAIIQWSTNACSAFCEPGISGVSDPQHLERISV